MIQLIVFYIVAGLITCSKFNAINVVSTQSINKHNIQHTINHIAVNTVYNYSTSTLHELSSALTILHNTNSLSLLSNKQQFCESIQILYGVDTDSKTPSNIQNLYYTTNINERLQCTQSIAQYYELINYGISSRFLPNIYYTTQIIELLSQNNKLKLGDINEDELKQLIPVLIDWIDSSDGTSRLSSESTESTIYGTALNLYSIGTLYRLVDKQHTLYSKQYDTVQTYAEQVLSTIIDDIVVDIPQSHLPSHTTALTGIAQLMSGIHAVGSTSSNGLHVDHQQLSLVVSTLLDNYMSHDIVELSSVIDSLYSISRDKAIQDQPVVLSVHSVSNHELSVKLTDILGKAISDASIELSSVHAVTISDSTATGTLKHTLDGVYTLPHKLIPGVYTGKFSIKPSHNNIVTLDDIERTIIITRQFSGASLHISTIDNTGKSTQSSKSIDLTYPSTTQNKLQVDATKILQLKLTLTDSEFQPDTVYAVVSHSSVVSRYPIKLSKTGSGYECNINFGSATFLEHSSGNGVYDIILYIGDVTLQSSVQWHIQSVTVELPSITIPKQITDAELWQSQPVIQHIFPRAERRPNKLVAIIFSILSCIPLCGLLYYVVPQISTLRLPYHARELLSMTVYQSSIAAMLGIFILYWIRLNIFSAMTLLLIVSTVAIFSGTETLRNLHIRNRNDGLIKKTE